MLHAQNTFEKYYSYQYINVDNIYAAEAPDGNFVVCNRAADVYKIDVSGNVLWSERLNDQYFPAFAIAGNEGHKFEFDNNGEIIVVGSYNSEAIVKIDGSNGSFSTQIKGIEYLNGNNAAYGAHYITKAHMPNQYIICGQNSLYNKFFNSFYMKLVDDNGDVIWYKEYVNIYAGPNGNTINTVKPTLDGGFILIGTSRISLYCNVTQDVVIIKTDAWGNIVWTNEYSFTNHNFGFDITQLNNGDYVAILNSWSPEGVIMRINALGNIVWSKIYYLPEELTGFYYKQLLDDDGIVIAANCGFNIITGESCDYRGSLIKIDYNGNFLWAEKYASPYPINSVAKTSDNGFIIAGDNGLVIKTDSKGATECSYPIVLESAEFLPYCIQPSEFFESSLGFQANYNGTSEDILMIKENVCCTFTPSISGNTFLCDNNPVTLDAGYYVGASYSWFPGGQTTQIITVNTPGTYSVIITDENGCIGKASVTVSVGNSPIPPQILGSNLVCDGTPNYCIAPFNPQLQYSWSAPNAQSVTPYNNDECATIIWTNAGGLITVTVTDPTTGCTNTTTLKVNPCCDGIVNGVTATFTNRTASSVLNDPNYSSFIAGNMVTTFTIGGGNYIAINGVFTIDTDINFTNAEIVLNPEAEIIILNNNTFSTEKSHLHACENEMWKRIHINSQALAKIDITKIEDANTALHSIDGGNFIVYDATFNKNWTGIHVNSFLQTHPGTVKKSLFQCTGTLLPPYAGKRSDAGIYVNNNIVQWGVDITIGDPVSPALQNTFENHNAGIRVRNASVNIYNNLFKNNLLLLIPFNTQGPGVGIHTIGPNEFMQINIGNGSNSHANTFSNCSYGIIAEGKHNLSIDKNNFTTIQLRGITVQNMLLQSFPFPPNSQIHIKNNVINNATTGIYLYNNPNVTALVQENTINLAGVPLAGGTGISGFEFPISANTNTTTLFLNTINNHRRGIEMTGFDRLLVRQNYINNQKTSPVSSFMPSFGIRLQGCQRVRAQSNTVSVQSPQTNTNIFGISVEMCQDALVDCNQTKFTGTGLRAAGQMPFTQFWANKMQSHNTGFVLWSNSSLPKQFRPGTGNLERPSDNTWYGNFSCRSKVISTSPSPNFVVRSQPQYNPKFLSQQCPPFNISSPTQLTNYLCPYIVQKPPVFGLLQQIAQGQFPNGDTLKWLARQQALWGVISDSTYWNDTLLIQFRDSALLSNMGALHYLDSLVNNASACTQVSLSQLNAVTPINNVEKNMRDVLQICIPNILNGSTTLSQQQIAVLQNIAVLCPFEDGMAVYQARMLLQPYDSTYYLNTCETTMDNNNRMAENRGDEVQNAETTETQFSVFPNPAFNEININYNLSNSNKDVLLKMYDVSGSLVHYCIINGEYGNYRINTDNFSAGIYLLRIEGKEGLLLSEKIAIQK